MKKYQVSENEIEQLETIANDLYSYRDMLQSIGIRVDLGSESNIFKLGSLLKFEGNSVYEFKKKLTISKNKLKKFEENIQELKKQKITVESEDKLEKIFSRCESIIKSIQARELTNQKNSVSNIEKINKAFINTTWYIYERFADHIGRKVIQFNEAKNDRIAVQIKIAKEGMTPWEGLAHFDSTQNFLVILTYNDSLPNSLVTNYLLRVASSVDVNKLTMCIGHMSFINDLYNNVVTKTVILERTHDAEPTPDNFKFNAVKPEKTTNDLDLSIVKFLFDRKQNRLSTPHSKIINSSGDLKEWLSKNDEIKRENRNEAIIGEYHLCYSRPHSTDSPTVDRLKIECSQYTGDLVSEYSHAVGRTVQIWKGTVTYSPITRAIFLDLKGPRKTLNENANDSPIFLILNMPSGEREFEVLTGLICGILDDYSSSIAMLATALKIKEMDIKDGSYSPAAKPTDQDLKAVSKFFKNFTGINSIVPPNMPVLDIRGLENSKPYDLHRIESNDKI